MELPVQLDILDSGRPIWELKSRVPCRGCVACECLKPRAFGHAWTLQIPWRVGPRFPFRNWCDFCFLFYDGLNEEAEGVNFSNYYICLG